MVSLQLGTLLPGVNLIRKHLFGFHMIPIEKQRKRSDETADTKTAVGGKQIAFNVGTQ